MAIERHTREVQTPYSHMDLGEHVSYLLGQVCDEVDYPMEVTVTIEAEEIDSDSIDAHAGCELTETGDLTVCQDHEVVVRV